MVSKMIPKCWTKRSKLSKVVACTRASVAGVCLLQVTTCLPTNGAPSALFGLSWSEVVAVIWPLVESLIF